MKTETGSWIRKILLAYFRHTSGPSSRSQTTLFLTTVMIFPPIFHLLLSPPTSYTFPQNEIKAALFDMGPLKSPGPDGFHPIFFQRSWDILASPITDFIQTVFRTATFPSTLNT